ncbi:mycothiol synthase [Salinibacterium sp. SYSU T00001]|uniref:mycothiol synthase n=1 Tax=Homoserinimonas sedimenticola TaxID=2986805 RepID=UPI002235FD83|nr:mycothiol synthase [Salinibacterium sedimenticola]MCW4386121.1 mycothiol synthase [Salinibacterium sedimenticola]
MRDSTPVWLDGLVTRATRVDGQPPFSDQSRVELRDGRRELLAIDEDAAAILQRGNPGELELVVDPAARRRGLGRELLTRAIEANPSLLAWAHGDHPGARALARSTGFTPIRTLLQLRAPVAAVTDTDAASDALADFEPFRPGVDDADWLTLNAAAFAGHPEQGSLTQADLDARMAEPWFDPEDLLLLRDRDGLAAFCWLKVEGEVGEFYVVGVDPSRQSAGLGRRLVSAGLARLASRGIRTASLYVDADNAAAVRLYRSYGFADHTVDVQYRRER